MSDAPPPYPGNEKAGMYPPVDHNAPHGGYAPPPGSYPPPSGAGYGQPSYPPAQPYPPPAGAPPPGGQYGGPQTTVVVQQPTAVTMVRPGEQPMGMNCPQCHAQIVTGTVYETGTLTWIICVVLCLVGCDLGCCFIPFCVDACKDVVHTCPNCKTQVARYNRM